MLLFYKNKSISFEQENNIIKIHVEFKDHFHEMKSTVTINSDSMMIMSAEAQMISSPWDSCYEVVTKMEGLAGLTIRKGIKEQVRKMLGGSQGCVHLVELTLDSITTMVQLWDYHKLPKEMPYKEKMEKVRETNKGICHTYSRDNLKLLKENLQSQID